MPASWSSPPLPHVVKTPVRHHHSCLSLSTTLLEYLCSTVQGWIPKVGKSAARVRTNVALTIRDNKPVHDDGGGTDDNARRRRTVVLSVGSGTGLVERLLWEKITASEGDTESSVDIAAMELSSSLMVPKASYVGLNLNEEEEEGKEGKEGKENIHLERRRVQLYGIEVPTVSPSPQTRTPAPDPAKGASVNLNAFLPPTHRITVNGTWDVLTPSDLLELLVVDRARADGEAEAVADVEADWDPEHDDDHEHDRHRGWLQQPQPQQKHATQSKRCHPQQPYQDDLRRATDAATLRSRNINHDDDEAIDIVLMFIYPRQLSLVRQYIDAYAPSSSFPRSDGPEHTKEPCTPNPAFETVRLKAVIWAGPRADWDEHYAEVFSMEWTSRREGKWDVIVRWGGGGGGGDDDDDDDSGGDSERDDSRVLDVGVGVGVGDGEGVAVATRVD